MGISTHILDTSRGKPAVGITVELASQDRQDRHAWTALGHDVTDGDGRCKALLGEQALQAAIYRLRFATEAYFRERGVRSLYPYVDIVFQVEDPAQHFHIPLLLTANGYTTYRGS